MDILSAILLGFVQGITEFLPVSSTGHLILARELFGLDMTYGLAFDAMLHLATALAVGIYFYRDIIRLAGSLFSWVFGRGVARSDRILILALVLGTIPAAVLGVLLESTMDTLFRSATLVAWVLIAGSLLMLAAEYAHKQIVASGGVDSLKKTPTIKSAIAIGFFQALALIPGISRSGATISGGLLLGLNREAAARFAFLLSFPIILGAGAKKALELESAGAFSEVGAALFFGSITAFVVGLLAIHFMLRFLRSHTLIPFVVYRLALAAYVLLML